MSDRSDRNDDLSSDVAGAPIEQDSGESETDQEGDFFDLEAEESDGYEEEEGDENEADDDYGHRSEHYSFPQFSRLPPELRTMIWEAVDPDLKSKARVLDFIAINNTGEDGDFTLWESATLAQQTAPARTLLATHRESRRIALPYYPDTIQLRRGLGEVRFNSANDIILLRLPQNLGSDLHDLGCSKIKYLAIDNGLESYPNPDRFPALDNPPQGLEAIFYCFEAAALGHRILDWSVSESSKQFYVETFEERPGLSEDFKALYCWPDTSLHTDFFDQVGLEYMVEFPEMPPVDSIPVWPMAQYSFDNGLVLYQKAKHYYERIVARRENGSASPLESSEGESFYESEPDDYALDGFVVDSSSEGGEEASDDEDDDVNDNEPRGSNDHEDSFDGDNYEEGARFHQDLDDFNGFSPLQDPGDDEATGNLMNVTPVVHDVESYEDHISDAPSAEEQPLVAKQSSRRKRRIVSSDDESDGDDGVISPVEIHTRVTKRARFAVSDDEGDEDGSGTDAGPEVEGSLRSRKHARIILSDREDGEDDGHIHSEGDQLPEHGLDSDEDEDDDGGTEEEEEDGEEEDEEEPRASKPVSLLARLRQFRSDIPVSPQGESPVSGEEYDEEERYEDEDERQLSDAEFPESAEEEGDQDGL
ncbi:hypothetical protein F5B21DRAFT_460334 [Xylaria acuta]|nr:hypothetical protein F5B21DRAFT_460334 [Xylaria acuta]